MSFSCNIKVKKLRPHAELPTRGSEQSAGWDVRSVVSVVIPPGGREVIPTGLAMEIPAGWEVQVRPRSGLAAKNGVTVLNTPGTIDADYRGEVKVILANLGSEPLSINDGDRIAQLVPAMIPWVSFEETRELGATARGEGGFGSTGVSS